MACLKQTFSMPDGTTYNYAYDDNDNVTRISIPGVGDVTYPSYTLSRPDSVTFPGGSTHTYQYDALMRIERIQAPEMDYQYTSYDGLSNILTKTTEHGNYTYGYDDVSRLLTADNPVLDDEAYTYDGVGNRETASGVSGSITHNANNELTIYGEISYDYDANGNMIRKSLDSVAVIYTYNVANRLIQVEDEATATVIAEYGYDPFGRRLWKEVDGVRTSFLYADEGLVAEYDESGTKIRSYGYRPDSTWGTNPLWLKENGEYYWYQNDHLGTPQKLIDNTGTVVWSAQYSSFGEADVQVETIVNNLRLPGQYFDAETGLHYNWNRYYDPLSGRYVKTDPIGVTGGLHLFGYVTNNPLNRLDPWGLSSGECVPGLNECIIRRARGYVGQKPAIGDCADVALTVLVECAAELKVPLSLPYRKAGKWKYYRSKDFESTETFAKFIRAMMGSINLYDNPTKPGVPRITKLKDLEKLQPGDLILYDLRYQGGGYDGHTRILIEIDEDAWLWPYGVVEGHMGGAAAEESWYAMNGWIWGIANQWRGAADGKARTWDCRIFR